MKLSKDLMIRVWKNKGQILEGIVNSVFSNQDIQDVGDQRITICRSNICGLYDKDGSSEKAVLKGEESCAGCGCALKFKTVCLSCSCHLQDVQQHPLWIAEVSHAEEEVLRERLNRVNVSQENTAEQR